MSLRLNFCLAVLLFNCGILLPQLYYVKLPAGHDKIHTTNDRVPGLVGSPYLSDDWSKGSIALYNGDVIDDITLKYNVFKKEMLFQADGDIYVLSSPDSVLFITMGDRRFVYLPVNDRKKKSEKDYFEELSDGDACRLLLRHTASILKSNYNVALNVGEKDDRMEHQSAYYLRKDNLVVPVDRKGENLYRLLADKSAELRDFVKERNLSFASQDDLKQIIDYYNSFYLLPDGVD